MRKHIDWRGKSYFEPEEITAFEKIGSEIDFPRHTKIIKEGNRDDAAYFLWSGFVVAKKRQEGEMRQEGQVEASGSGGRNDKEVLSGFLGIRGRGELVGERAALFNEPRSADIIAFTDVETLLIPGDKWLEYCKEENPGIAWKLWGIEKSRATEAERRLRDSTLPPQQRFARLLYEFATHGPSRATGDGVEIELSQLAMAQLVGVSRESISPIVGILKNKGVVGVIRGKTVIRNLDSLKMVADGLEAKFLPPAMKSSNRGT